MNIQGFQKLTLLDFPGHMSCTVFTGGCNLRCPFCHNALLVENCPKKAAYSEEEILNFISKRNGLLDGVSITGGEPLLQPDIRSFIEKIKSAGFLVKLDTNGTYPTRLKELVNAGLVDYVAVDIKNSKSKYALTTGTAGALLPAIEESVSFLMEGHVPYEFRTTVVKEFHTVGDIVEIGRWISGCPAYFLQNFVDSGNLIESGLHPVSFETMSKMKESVESLVGQVSIRGISE